ncbi:uncharacterized protein Hap1MRO34_009151 [Clarias gariepinus]
MSAECEKMTSEKSLEEELGEMKSGTEIRPRSPGSSCVSFKSDHSMPLFINFKEGTVTHERITKQSSKIICRNSLESIFKELEHKFIIIEKQIEQIQEHLVLITQHA